MRWTHALIAAVALVPRPAGASETGIRVEHEPGTETCPDASALSSAVGAVRGRSPETGTSSSYRVTFSRSDTVFEARIENLRDQTVRTLNDASETCEALARATAVTLALLLDADATGATDDAGQQTPNGDGLASSAVPKADAPGTSVEPPAPEHRSRTDATRAITVHAGGGALLGAIRPAAPLLSGGAGVELRAFSASIGAAWASPGELDLDPGHVSTSFVGITLESCVALVRAAATRVDLCSGLLAGLVGAEASGYTRNDARSRPWLSIPFGIGAGADWSGVRLGLHASALMPLRRQEFRVDGVGIAYESPPVAGMLSLRATARLPF